MSVQRQQKVHEQNLVATCIPILDLVSFGLRDKPYTKNSPQLKAICPVVSEVVTSHFQVCKKLQRSFPPFLKSEESEVK